MVFMIVASSETGNSKILLYRDRLYVVKPLRTSELVRTAAGGSTNALKDVSTKGFAHLKVHDYQSSPD
jgi:hypothetical protein